jgi:DNA-binding CsgD family transcriptional regulator
MTLLDDFKKEAECPTSNARISSKSRRKYKWMTIEDEQEVKKAAARGMSVREIARIFNFDRRTVEHHLKGEISCEKGKTRRKTSREIISKMRAERQHGISIVEIAKKYDLNVRTVQSYTKGFNLKQPTLTEELIQQIRYDVTKGISKQYVALKYNISDDVVKRLTMDIASWSKLQKEQIDIIREKVRGGKTKIQVAHELGVSIYMVKKHTQDIPTMLRIPVELEQKIREEVRKGKSTQLVAEELNVSRDTVIKYTRDIPKSNDPLFSKREKLP